MSKLFTRATVSGTTLAGSALKSSLTTLWDALNSFGITDSARTTVTTSATLATTQCGLLLADCTGASVTLTLPSSGAATDDATYTIRRIDSTVNTLTVQRGGTDTIEGATTGIVIAPGSTLQIQIPAGSTNWRIVQATTPATGYFNKADTSTVAFTKTGASTLQVKAGTKVEVAGTVLNFATATTVVMPTLVAGTDYAIYACTDGTIRADSSFSAPSGYSTVNSRQVGGFHYGLVAPATTLAGGSFNTTGSPVGGGMVWVQGDVDNIAGINLWSLWDLKWRPRGASPKGMVLVNGSVWVDIYLCSTDTAANGTSKYNTNIASGTVLPKVPAAFGGNGTLTYSTLTFWEASELARANQKRLMFQTEFFDAAFGVTENQSIDATASTYPTTLRNAGYTSKWGIEQASGHHYTWGQDTSGTTPTAWAANGGRGQSYNNSTMQVILGGARTGAAYSGSRCASFNNVAANSNWSIGLRAACDHLILV